MTIRFSAATAASTYATAQNSARRRAQLGLRSMSTQSSSAVSISGGGVCATSFDSTNVAITGGSISGVLLSGSFESSAMYITGGKIDGTPIGATGASSGNFSALDASSAFQAAVFVTTDAPAYGVGKIYFDTTLNKLRVGGASTWETITST